MKIAIHHNPGSFSDRWITYCEEHCIPYKIVNAYDSDIIHQLEDCDAFMWHHLQDCYQDVLFAKQLLYSLQIAGKKVFPDFCTGWHFDDKVGQKYMFESIGAPLVPSYVFYNQKDALTWIKKTSFPKVFKLRGGAASTNVKLVHSQEDAKKLVKVAFSKGFRLGDQSNRIKEVVKQYQEGSRSFYQLLRGLVGTVFPSNLEKILGREKGYLYFQDFIPNNNTDTRIVVVGNKIIGERRGCRKGDFRASGSNILLPDVTKVDMRCVKIAFTTSQRLKLQTAVYDFVHDINGNPLIVEVSYGSVPDYTECEGYWDENFIFHKSFIDLSAMIIESFILSIKNS